MPEKHPQATSHRLLLRKLDGGRFEEVGEVVADTKTSVTVTLPSGGTSELPRAGHVFVTKGGVFHLLRMHPGWLEEIFQSHPTTVLEQVLSESTGRLSMADVKNKLTNLQIPLATIEQAWPALKTHLESAGTIGATGSPKKYEWIGGPRPSGLLEFLPDGARTPAGTGSQEAATPASTPTVARQPVDASDHRSVSTRPRPAPRGEKPFPPHAETETEVDADGASLVRLLQALGAPQELQTVDHVVGRLLECASLLTQASAGQIAEILTLTGPERDAATALLAALPGRSRVPREFQPILTVEQARAAVELAVGELTRADDDVRRRIAPAAIALFTRLLLSDTPVTLPLPLLARVLGVLQTHAAGAETHRERLARLLAATLAELGPEAAEAVVALDHRSLARSVRDLELDVRSGRALLLSALYAASPTAARQPHWWAHVGFNDLARAAKGPLSRVMLDEQVAAAYIAPAVRSALAEVSTRPVLATIIGAPPELARHASSDSVLDAFTRCTHSDPIAKSWLAALSQQDVVDQARQASFKAAAAVTEAEERFRTARLQVEQLSSERAKLLDQILYMRQEDRRSSDARDRQVKLDVLRTLATLALSIAESPGASSDAALLQDLEYVTGREGLRVAETSGSEVPYEPERHDSLGQRIEPGAPVFVLRAGYTYSSPHEDLVLIKAQVSPR